MIKRIISHKFEARNNIGVAEDIVRFDIVFIIITSVHDASSDVVWNQYKKLLE